MKFIFWKSAALYVYLFIFRKRFFDFWTAVAYFRFHQDLMQRMITLIGCPKLDQGDTSTRHSEIFSLHVIRSVTVAVMEVLCCSEVTTSLQQSTAYQQTVDPVESRYDFEKQNVERIKNGQDITSRMPDFFASNNYIFVLSFPQ